MHKLSVRHPLSFSQRSSVTVYRPRPPRACMSPCPAAAAPCDAPGRRCGQFGDGMAPEKKIRFCPVESRERNVCHGDNDVTVIDHGIQYTVLRSLYAVSFSRLCDRLWNNKDIHTVPVLYIRACRMHD